MVSKIVPKMDPKMDSKMPYFLCQNSTIFIILNRLKQVHFLDPSSKPTFSEWPKMRNRDIWNPSIMPYVDPQNDGFGPKYVNFWVLFWGSPESAKNHL